MTPGSPTLPLPSLLPPPLTVYADYTFRRAAGSEERVGGEALRERRDKRSFGWREGERKVVGGNCAETSRTVAVAKVFSLSSEVTSEPAIYSCM